MLLAIRETLKILPPILVTVIITVVVYTSYGYLNQPRLEQYITNDSYNIITEDVTTVYQYSKKTNTSPTRRFQLPYMWDYITVVEVDNYTLMRLSLDSYKLYELSNTFKAYDSEIIVRRYDIYKIGSDNCLTLYSAIIGNAPPIQLNRMAIGDAL